MKRTSISRGINGGIIDGFGIMNSSVVYIRYSDHVLFKDSTSSRYAPWLRECVGWLDYEDEMYIRVVWERFKDPNQSEDAGIRSTGLAILKSSIVEMKQIA